MVINSWLRSGDVDAALPQNLTSTAKSGFNLKEFYATEAALHMVNLAYNMISLFRQASSEKPNHQRLQTLRLNCYAVAA